MSLVNFGEKRNHRTHTPDYHTPYVTNFIEKSNKITKQMYHLRSCVKASRLRIEFASSRFIRHCQSIIIIVIGQHSFLFHRTHQLEQHSIFPFSKTYRLSRRYWMEISSCMPRAREKNTISKFSLDVYFSLIHPYNLQTLYKQLKVKAIRIHLRHKSKVTSIFCPIHVHISLICTHTHTHKPTHMYMNKYRKTNK